jgi:6-phosphogluconate dehydrogenase
MFGGDKKVFKAVEPALRTLAPKNGYMYCGGAGAGHFVKMAHNGIEYGMMEAYAEGFQLLRSSPYGKKLNLSHVAAMWNSGSVVRSWLLELLVDVFKNDQSMKKTGGYVEDSGEARWMVKEAVDSGVALDVISTALYKRFNSRQKDVFANRVTAGLRNAFGGHATAAPGRAQKGDSAGVLRHARKAKK